MAWGGSRRDMIVAENAAMKREIELLREKIDDLKEDRNELRKQLKATQDALVAKESPDAYRDLLYARENENQEEPSPEELAEKMQQKQRAEVAARYLNEMESPLFKDADDMIQMLTRATGVPLSETTSLHGNDES